MPTFLVADSSPVQRISLSAVVRHENIAHTVLTAATGIEAMALVGVFRPLYLMASVRLLDMESWTLFERVRAVDPDARFMLLTDFPEFYRLIVPMHGVDGCVDSRSSLAEMAITIGDWMGAPTRPALWAHRAPGSVMPPRAKPDQPSF